MRSAGFCKYVFAALLSGAFVWAAAAPDLSLIDAVKRRDAKSFAKIMGQRGVDVNVAAPDGATALSWAIFLGLNDMAESLLAGGANVNTVGEYGETPLTLALANGDAS
jgi:ankyrin repeat protein